MNDLILGIDAITQGKGKIDFPRKTFTWFNHVWSLQGEKASQIIYPTAAPVNSPSLELDRVLKQYEHVFSSKLDYLQPCKLPPIQIITEGDPICQRAYRAPLTKRQEISKAIDEMLAQGIIQPSCSPWASPVTLVPKPDGSTRFCVDYRKLNQKDRWPLPLCADVLDAMQGSTIFSTMDLKSGFHQIPVAPADREKTAFICHRGLFEFTRMPFGLANGPSHFQRVMDSVFSDLIGVCVMVYIDDIVIFSKTPQEHKKHIEIILERLDKFGLQVKPEKCNFGMEEIKLLGFVINRHGAKANPEKTLAISKMAPPKNVKQVRSFLGMAGYYRQFIQGYAALAQPLTELTRKHRRFSWSPECQGAFDSLKADLTSNTIVRHPRVDLPYTLYTDASDLCIGAILCQTHEDGKEYVVQYISHQLSATQRRWATIEKEAYAVVYALQKLRAYLYGAQFVVYTDHKPLLCLFSKSMNNTKIQRWAILLAEYGAAIKYRPGPNNIRADMLSRLPPASPVAVIDPATEYTDPVEEPADILDDLLPFNSDGLDRDRLSQAQQEDFSDLWGKAGVEDSGYIIVQNVLYSVWTPSTTSPEHPRIVLPPQFQQAVIDRAHKEVGHMATQKTLARLREAYVWPHMRESIKARISQCPVCTVHQRRQDHVPMGDMPIPASPMQIVAMDIIGPFVASTRNNKYLLTIVDHCSGWAEAYPLPDRRTDSVWHVFHNRFVASHGCPEILISDNAREFTTGEWTDYLKKMGIKHVRSTPSHPQSNGKAERFNRTFKEMLAKAVNNAPTDWEDHVGSTLFSHRISVSDVTHYSPFYLMHGRQPRAPLSKLLHIRDPTQGLGTRVDSLSTALSAARVNSEGARKHNRERLAQKANAGELAPGDMVVLIAPEPLTLTSKWDPLWQVTRVANTTIFLRHQQSGRTKKVHRSKVKLADPNIIWDEIPPRPKRQQNRGPPREGNVDIQVNPGPPTHTLADNDNPDTMPSSPEPQPSTSAHNMDIETGLGMDEPPPGESERGSTPVHAENEADEPERPRPVRARRGTGRSPRGVFKRELSPQKDIPQRVTRWNSLSEEEKRRKRVRYDVLAGRTNSNIAFISTTYTVC